MSLREDSIDKNIICFGELLWDMLPHGKQAGGAPMNVAYHLNRLGLKAFPFTAVGQDDLGRELIEFLNSKNIPTILIQENEHPTGMVLVKLNEKNEASYSIENPSAWDYIQVGNPEADLLLNKSPIVVFGSLACRHTLSHQSLLAILSYAGLKICDINLRAPYYSPDLVFQLLGLADWVKINNDELNLIAQWFGTGSDQEPIQAQLLLERFPFVSKLLVTRGDKGAAYYDREGNSIEHPGFQVKVVDTVGSGDSFLAMFIAQFLKGSSIEHALEASCAMGAIVARHAGATSWFETEKEISDLIQSGDSGKTIGINNNS
ncbi:MAG: carbohydrate kinase [Saprospiraceae bacterium]|nr:carbohydrate kinase [Saprospiraceae bacterium]